MIKMSLSSAKRLGFSIKGYVFIKEKTTLQPVIEKTKNCSCRAHKSGGNKTVFKKKGNVYKLDLEKYTTKGS